MYLFCICDWEIHGCKPNQNGEIHCAECSNKCQMAGAKITQDNKAADIKVCPHCESSADDSYQHVKLSSGIISILNEHLHAGKQWIFSKHC